MKYGLIGEKLSHSYSQIIHEQLGSHPYDLVELAQSELALFMQKKMFEGINVTIPFKQAVIGFCDVVDERAAKIGTVNTIVNRAGKLIGYNTDYMGFAYLLDCNNIVVSGKNVLILGSGATANTVRAVIDDRGGNVTLVSRNPIETQISYSKAYTQIDTNILVNTTPVGMYPRCNELSFNIELLTKLDTVVDVIYNPKETALLKSARERGFVAVNGVNMLIAQAFHASEFFLGKSLDKDKIIEIHQTFNERGIL